MKILYVTSFPKNMYDVTGKRLIESFLKYMPSEEKMAVYYENMDFEALDVHKKHKNRFLTHNLNQNDYLNSWLERNKDIIPVDLGGTATPKNHPEVFTAPVGGGSWNKKASKWFRKIATMVHVNENYREKYDFLVWLDCDCVITKTIPPSFYKNHTKYDFLYFFGPARRKNNSGYETGFVCYNMSGKGSDFIEELKKIYEHDFKKYPRWDDGYIVRMVNENISPKKYNGFDLAKNSNTSHPINMGNHPLKDHIKHDKGTHWRLNLI